MLKQIFERRSCRKYSDKKVEKEKIEEVIKAGLYASCARGQQTGIIIAITNKEVRDKLSSLNASIMNSTNDPFYGAPIVLLVAVKKGPTCKYDGATMIENMMIEATNQDLGSCWIHRAFEELETDEGRELLASTGLNFDEYEGVGHVILGYPDSQPSPKTIKDNRVFYID